jgi:hypothetical protein
LQPFEEPEARGNGKQGEAVWRSSLRLP